jgi:hypothetical protein
MSDINSVSSITRSSLYEYAGVLVDLDRIVAGYMTSSQNEKLAKARSLANMIVVMKSIERNGLAGSEELRTLLNNISTRAEAVGAKVDSGASDAQILSAMDTFINDGVTTASDLINNALNPTYWQTNNVPVSIRDSISDFAFFEYYRTADAVMASSMGSLANRIQISENFLKAINKIYLGVTWNPGSQFINTRGELQDSVTTISGTERNFQAYDGENWYDPQYRQTLFAAANVNTTNNTITLAGHGFSNGDQVYYSATNGESGGLIANVTYWVTDVSGDSFKLTSVKNDSSKIIDITSTGGSAQKLERYSFVDSADKTLYVPNHGYSEGNAVVYTSSQPIDGLQTGLTYYVKNVTANSFSLSEVPGGSTIAVKYGLGERANVINSFVKAGNPLFWYDKFQEDKVLQSMVDGVTALKSMVSSGLLPVGSVERTVADQIIAKWEIPYVSGGLGAVSTSSAAARMWSDKTFKKIIEDGINGTSRLNEQSQLDLSRALSNYDYFTRSATTFVSRESESVKSSAQRIKLG